jgi:solute:Na+ symporter, SSS family
VRAEKDLVGLVYALTDRPSSAGLAWYQRPAALGLVVLGGAVLLNLLFW